MPFEDAGEDRIPSVVAELPPVVKEVPISEAPIAEQPIIQEQPIIPATITPVVAIPAVIAPAVVIPVVVAPVVVEPVAVTPMVAIPATVVPVEIVVTERINPLFESTVELQQTVELAVIESEEIVIGTACANPKRKIPSKRRTTWVYDYDAKVGDLIRYYHQNRGFIELMTGSEHHDSFDKRHNFLQMCVWVYYNADKNQILDFATKYLCRSKRSKILLILGMEADDAKTNVKLLSKYSFIKSSTPSSKARLSSCSKRYLKCLRFIATSSSGASKTLNTSTSFLQIFNVD
jgi:uncharacterized protein YlbG (UPF0298 family)